MSNPKIITHSGLTLNIDEIRCFRLNIFDETPNDLVVTIEYKTRSEFIKHPETDEWIEKEYNESTSLKFLDYGSASTFVDEWEEIWQRHLNSI